MLSLGDQVVWLFLLAIPVASIAWTVTHEEVFKEVHEYCTLRATSSQALLVRKFFYLLTCEYCFSHYVTIVMLVLTGYKLLMSDWRGYLIGGFGIVWIANLYMTIYSVLRGYMKKESVETKLVEKESNMTGWVNRMGRSASKETALGRHAKPK
jgi:hypothetical protein